MSGKLTDLPVVTVLPSTTELYVVDPTFVGPPNFDGSARIELSEARGYLAPEDQQIVYVRKGGNDSNATGIITSPFLTISAAIASISDASEAKQYLIDIGPGVYAEALIMTPWISYRGSMSSATDDAGTIIQQTGGPMLVYLDSNDTIGGVINFSSISFAGSETMEVEVGGTSGYGIINFTNCNLPVNIHSNQDTSAIYLDCFITNCVSVGKSHILAGGAFYIDACNLWSVLIGNTADDPTFVQLNGCLFSTFMVMGDNTELWWAFSSIGVGYVDANASGDYPTSSVNVSSGSPVINCDYSITYFTGGGTPIVRYFNTGVKNYIEIPALEIDVNAPFGSKTLTGDDTLTYSEATPTQPKRFSFRFNAGASARAITIPTTYSLARGGNITALAIPANTVLQVTIQYVLSPTARWEIIGDPVDSTGTGAYVLATSPSITTPTLNGITALAANASIGIPGALSDGQYAGETIAGTAGATLAFGQVVYLAAADSRWELTDADAAATAGPVKVGICVLAAAADGDPTRILLRGVIRADSQFPAMTISAPVYIGTTAGEVQVAAPSGEDDVVRVVGQANTADELSVNISPDWATVSA